MFLELCVGHRDEGIMYGSCSYFEYRVVPFRVIKMTDGIVFHDLREELFCTSELWTNVMTMERAENVAPFLL